MSQGVDACESSGRLGPAEADRWPQTVTLALLGGVSLFLLAGWDAVLALVAVPAIVGACLGASTSTPSQALRTSALAASLGTVTALGIYSIVPTLGGNPTLALALESNRPWLAVVCCLLILPASAWSTAALLQRTTNSGVVRRAVSWSIVALIALSFVGSMRSPVATWAQTAGHEPAAGSYSVDSTLNLKTYYLMQDGEDFYTAYANAHAGDSRQLYPVRNGKFLTGSAAMMRQPTMFYLWQFVAPNRDLRVVAYLSVMLAALLLVGVYWAMRDAVGERALFLCLMFFPALVMQSNGLNTMFPEWWGVLALLAGFLSLVRRRVFMAGAFGLLSVAFRETFGVWLLALGIGAVVFALRDRREWRWVATYLGLLAAGVLIYLRHVAAGTSHVLKPMNSSVFSYLLQAAARPWSQRFEVPIGYLMVPYASSLVSPVWLVVIGVMGLWVGLRHSTSARLVSTLYAVIFLGYFAVLGATAPYWGEAVMPLLVIGAGLFLASLDTVMSLENWVPAFAEKRWGE